MLKNTNQSSVNLANISSSNQLLNTFSTPSFNGLSLTGTSLDNSVSNILGLNGSTVVYVNDLIDVTSLQTLTNKTINSAVNTLTITSSPVVNTNINSLINQDLRTTAAPIFTGVRLTGLAADNNGDRFMAIRADSVAVVLTS